MTTSQRPALLAPITMAVLAVFAFALGAAADATASSPQPKDGVTLTGSYDSVFGFGFDRASLERLPDLLGPDEVLEVEVDGIARPADDVDWSAVAKRGRFPLVAVTAVTGAGSIRRVGELEVTLTSNTACTDEAGGEMLTPEREHGLQLTAGPGGDPIPIGNCVQYSIYWRCINCQCRSGIYVKSRSRNYICIYGTLYPQNTYNCNCPFTTRICSSGQT